MAVNDPIADMLTRIRNANLARHQTTRIPATRLTRSIASVLQSEGFITGFEEAEDGIKKFLVEVKPYKQTIKPTETPGKHKKALLYEQLTYIQNQAKWEAARQWCKSRGIEFTILTEKELRK